MYFLQSKLDIFLDRPKTKDSGDSMRTVSAFKITAFIFTTLLFTTFLLPNYSLAQFGSKKGAQVLVKGTVTDKDTGEPAGVKITIHTINKKKIKTQSNSVSGHYEHLLPAGQVYKFVFTNYDILRKEQTVEVRQSAKFSEEEIDFTVQKLKKGINLMDMNMFDPNSSSLTSSGKRKLKELQKIMRFNRSIKLDLIVNANDSFSNDSPKSQVSELVNRRADALKNYIKGWKRFIKRLNVVSDASISGGASNLVVSVNSVEDVMGG